MHYILIKKIKFGILLDKKIERIRYWFSKKLNLEFAGNLTSHYLPLIVMLFVMLLYHYTIIIQTRIVGSKCNYVGSAGQKLTSLGLSKE